MLLFSLILAALAVAAAGGFFWRRLDDLTREVHRLQALVEAQQGTAPAPAAMRRPAMAAAVAEATAPVVEGEPAEDESQILLFPGERVSNDPFDDGWVIRQGGRPAAAPRAETPRLVRPIPPPRMLKGEAPLPNPRFEPMRSPETTRPGLPRALALQALTAAGVLILPALALLFEAPPLAVGASALLLTLAVLAASARRELQALAWVAALGGGGWALFAVAASLAPWSAVAMAVLAAGALLHAAMTADWRPGAVLTLFAALGAYALAAPGDAVGLGVLGGILAAAAVVGAFATRLEFIHVGAWIGALAALALLGGQPGAALWFAPAAGWGGGLFLGIAAVRAPALGARSTVTSATGVSAALLAALSLHFAELGLLAPWEVAAVLSVVAAVFAGILTVSAREARGLEDLGLAIAPLGIGVAAAAGLAALLGLATPFAALAFAALAAGALFVNMRWPHLLWRLNALALGAGAIALGAATIGLIGAGLTDETVLLALAGGVAAPALMFAAGSWAAGPRAPITASLFEGGAILGATATVSLFIRWLAADGAPALQPITFAEAGLHAAAWAGLSLLLSARGVRGAWVARQAASALLALAAIGAMLFGPLSSLNPFWGAWRTEATGWPVANLLAVGFLIPAIFAFAHWRYWRARFARARSGLAFGVGVVLLLVWMVLEARRALHGADLAAGDITLTEWGVYVAILATAGALALGRRALRLSVQPPTSSSISMVGAPAKQAPILGEAARK